MKQAIATAAAAAFALGLLSSVAASQPAVEGPSVNWRIATFGSPRTGTTHIETIKKFVEEQTEGNFSITLGYGSLGEPREFLDLLQVGAVQGATVQPSLSGDRLPLYSVLDLPFLPLSDPKLHRAVHEAVHEHPAIIAEFETWDAMPFMSSLLPQYELMGTNDAPASLADINGMRIRALGASGDALNKLGAAAVNMPASEVYVALDRGLLDGVAFPYYAHVSFRTYELGKWMTTNLTLGTTAFPVTLSKSAWDELPQQYRDLLVEAREVAYEAQMQAIAADDVKSLETIKAQGVELIELSDEDLKQFREAGGQPVWDAWVADRAASGHAGQEMLDFVQEQIKQGGAE
jgi:TRAP-type C4-dicarboxylate transport system substrate-binding protein